ncbi:MAG: hypothetical protein JW779_06640 [Candidatus Thorarchaeota archaeon]|nr:hypothetical protein [Candidatus Thorarchaeota archaeon]
MPELPLRYFCYVCGHQNDLILNIPNAPKMSRDEITCTNCGDVTNLLLTACPHCNSAFKYFLSDLDFPQEMTTLASTYVKLIAAIKNSLTGVVKEFNIPLPKRWSVNLDCQCGKQYSVEIELPQIETL